MRSGNQWGPEGPHIERSINFWAWKLKRGLDLPTEELNDIKQEMRLDLVKRLPSFNPQKSSYRTFISMVLKNKEASLWESFIAAKRDVRNIAHSLDEEIEDEEGREESRQESLSSDKYQMIVYGRFRSNELQLELAVDLKAFKSLLNPEQRRICQLFEEGHNPTTASKVLGIARSTLNGRLKILRKRLAEFGYENSQNSPDTSDSFPVSNKYGSKASEPRSVQSKQKGGTPHVS